VLRGVLVGGLDGRTAILQIQVMKKVVANLIGILSIPIYYYGFVCLSGILVLSVYAATSVALGALGWFLILPVSVTLSIWFGHMTTRFLLIRWCHAGDASNRRPIVTRDHEPDTLQPPPNDLPL
jgi:hypothetical protein